MKFVYSFLLIAALYIPCFSDEDIKESYNTQFQNSLGYFSKVSLDLEFISGKLDNITVKQWGDSQWNRVVFNEKEFQEIINTYKRVKEKLEKKQEVPCKQKS